MKSRKTTIQSIAYFIITAMLIAYFFPREGKFRYQFFEGKPWKYGLLTAPVDVPIYKTEDELNAEKDTIRKRFEPYYRVNSDVKNIQIEKLNTDFKPSATQKPGSVAYVRYINTQLSKIYDKGILLPSDIEELKQKEQTRIYILKNNLSELKNIKDFYSTKSAYEEIIDKTPLTLDKEVLKSYNINNYLVENITYDKDMSERILNEQIQRIPLSTGIIQAGERIVDRGEIIDGRTFNALRSLKIIHETKSGGNQRTGVIWAGQLILVFGILFCCAIYLATFSPEIFYNRRNVLFILLFILSFCILSEVVVKYDLTNIYVIPYAIMPIIVRTFFRSHTALFTHLITVLLCSLVAPFAHEFLLMQIITGIVVIFTLKELTQRSQLLRCAFFILLSYILCYLSLSLYQEGDLNKINWLVLIFFGINFILLMFSYLLIYVLEKMFGYVSSITLVELSNINTPILKKLSETAPGTFQHSMNVSILAAEATAKVGGDVQLVRTGALYHDIGKMVNPAFFTENQKGGVNPHDNLPFEESAQIIISHVTEGVKMAEKAKLPQAIINFIRTHHGTGKTKYFYNSYKNAYPDQPIDEELFTYPGPNPYTKETGVLMMADGVEAASRSLSEYTDESIKGLVDKIIDGQIADNLLQNTPLTFNDISITKATFIDKLKTMNHTRISYPDLKTKNNDKTKIRY
ncbi:MAG: HDIG domain-containing protein [Tannerella sp.]|jgi:putative nucleotidyltransferase with HDIG domain|nr:HDIG domain-containing protein [Tannerella sp.]